MITILNKQNCSGCGACQQRCPKKAIALCEDHEGFLYPQVNPDKCIDCGICDKVCHEQNPYGKRTPLNVFAAINKNLDVRLQSSSGGIFTLLAEKVINENGVVFGARYDDDWQVVFDYTESVEGLSAFRGSKYVQSRTKDAYIQAEAFLKEGRKVLFSGTPCQIAGLHHFLQKSYNNLLAVDFVCHGVPSPKVWGLYLDEVVKGGRCAITDVQFRNKDNGWKKFNFAMSYRIGDETKSLSIWHQQNQYMQAFLGNMILRPSCYECKAKDGRSMSDITIADYWGVHKYNPEMDDDNGTGLVLVNTEKGKEAFDLSAVKYCQVDLSDALHYNKGLCSKANSHPHRQRFFDKIDDVPSIIKLIEDELRPPLSVRIKKIYHKYKKQIKNLIKK